MVSSAAISCLAVLLLAAGASAYPKALVGTWVGSCVTIATINSSRANAICTTATGPTTPKQAVVSPYKVRYWPVASKTVKGSYDLWQEWTRDDTHIYVNGWEVYSNYAYQAPNPVLAHVAPCNTSNTYCMTSKPKGVSIAMIARVTKVDAGMVYTESGTYYTQTNTPTKTCPTVPNLPLFCNAYSFNYKCTAYKVA